MALTLVIGSSGAGKTTFLNDVYKQHKCIYIRQFHSMRPYIPVTKIPNFDPTTLPYWSTYVKEEAASTIKVGGTMAGKFTAGLSGGQRKLLLFELIYQRTFNQKDLLIALDEPFAGVTDDFIPFIVERLKLMGKRHNIIVVTNDHVEALMKMTDNTIFVSSINRQTVGVNNVEGVNRDLTIRALSVGENFEREWTHQDLKFYVDVEIRSNKSFLTTPFICLSSFGLYILACWDSEDMLASLVIITTTLIGFFSINPYLLSLVEWRNAMEEEAEALMHCSGKMNRILTMVFGVALVFIVSVAHYVAVNAVVDGLLGFDILVGLVSTTVFYVLLYIYLSIFSELNFEAVQILGMLPFLFNTFFSTIFSPGSGLTRVKDSRLTTPSFLAPVVCLSTLSWSVPLTKNYNLSRKNFTSVWKGLRDMLIPRDDDSPFRHSVSWLC